SPAIKVTNGIGIDEFDHEGRVITLEYEQFYLVDCYTPNSQQKLKRLDFRLKWELAFQTYLKKLDQTKPVILCGDLNVAHQKIDLKNWKTNRHNAGFSDQERQAMTSLLDKGFIDSFRFLHPETTGIYSWWSYRFHARENNAGWRIDYFIVSDRLKNRILKADILTNIYGSDHCPVELELKE
ncbi:exodeoxyribonuclease III, partial [Liquorilactobacillus vini]